MVKATFAVELDSAQLAELMATLAGMGIAVSMKMGPVDGAAIGDAVQTGEDAQITEKKSPRAKPDQRANTHVNKECQRCGLGFVARSNSAKYCPSCRSLKMRPEVTEEA